MGELFLLVTLLLVVITGVVVLWVFRQRYPPAVTLAGAPVDGHEPTATAARFNAHDILQSTINNATGDIYNYTPAPPAAHTRLTLPPHKPFVGRADLLATLQQRLQDNHRVSVTSLKGIGGVGKSALALEAAYRFADLFPDGRYWVDLRSNDATHAMRTLLRALGVVNPEQLKGDLETLCGLVRGLLADQQVLLVLDNAEGILRQDARQLQLLCLPPPAKTLITSRTMIDSDDLPVDSLSDSDALALLAAKGVDLTSQTAAARQLCQRLGNLALALDITARRMALSRPTQTCVSALAALQESADLLDALRLPRRQSRDDNVAAAFALTYEQLDDELQTAFHALGVCAPSGVDGAGLAALLEARPSDTLDLLRALAMLSLVEFDGERGELHPLLHEYARLRGQQQPASWQHLLLRHVTWYGGEIGGGYQRAVNENEDYLPALLRTDAEQVNVLLAQQRVLSTEFSAPSVAVDVTNDLVLYWRRRYRDPEQLLNWWHTTINLARQTGQVQRQANVLQAIGDVQSFRDDKDAALASYEQALTLFTQVGDKLGQANVRKAIGDVQSFRDDKDAALASYEQALTLFTQVGDKLGQANVLQAIGDVQSFRDDKDAALASYEQALTLFTQVGAKLGQANVRKAIGDVQSFRDDKDAALASYEQALTLFTQVGDKLGQANVLQAIGDVQSFRDDKDAALASYEQALTLFTQVGDKLGQANVRKAIGDVQSFRDDKDAALASYEQALTLFTQVGAKLGQANTYLALGRLQGDAVAYERAIELYQTIRDLYSTARGRYYYAAFLLAQGASAQAQPLLQAARQDWAQINFAPGVAAVDAQLQEIADDG